LDQFIDTEAIDVSIHEVADSRLGLAKVFSGFGLRPLLRLNEVSKINHQIGTDF
jgi:hypothetical protein